MIAYLDLDGVLVDWNAGVNRIFGTDYVPTEWGGLIKMLGITEDALWRRINATPRFWESLPLTEDAYQILEIVEREFESVVLMTSPPRSSNAVAGKVSWIQTHLPKYKRHFAVTPAKVLFAHSGATLIDDYHENVIKFRDAGGKAVLVPRPWNICDSLEEQIRRIL